MKGQTNAINTPKKVTAMFSGKLYIGGSTRYWCMDADQISAFEEFVSDSNAVLISAESIEFSYPSHDIVPKSYLLYNYTLRSSIVFQTASISMTLKWHNTASGTPTQTRNTYSKSTAYSSASDGTVVYLSMGKVVL